MKILAEPEVDRRYPEGGHSTLHHYSHSIAGFGLIPAMRVVMVKSVGDVDFVYKTKKPPTL